MHVPFIESISGPASISPDAVLQVLEFRRTLGGNQEFKGKVSTSLYADERHVLKIKTPHALARDKAIAWCRLQLAKERSYGIYLPSRHWLVLENETGCAVANITERHVTLDMALSDAVATGNLQRIAALLQQLLRFYFRFWVDCALRQDDGLTNYVVAADQIYYIDDDIYKPDQLVSLAHGLAGILRRFDVLNEDIAVELGATLRQLLLDIDPVYPSTLLEHLDSVFLPPARAAVLRALCEALRGACRYKPSMTEAEPAVMPATRLALLADIHGNLPALQAVLSDMQREGISLALVLGDIVGYGPNPEACVELVRNRSWLFVRGNHDHALHLGEAGERFNRAARWSIEWTMQQVSQSTRDWLGSLPFQWRLEDLHAVHGSPSDPTFMNAYIYTATAEHNLDKLQEKGITACFHGHTHIPGVYYRDRLSVDHYSRVPELQMKKGERYLVCPGSVGLPRDGSQKAQYAIFDLQSRSLQFRELDYDHARVLADARAAGFPDFMMKMFERG